MLIKEQRYFKVSDGKDLYSYIWKDNEIVANKTIIICHGMAEHIDRYDGFVKELVKNKFIVFGYNQRGHRYTDNLDNYGYMGDNDNFNILVSDALEVVDYMKAKYPELPLFLFGHSMGSFVATRVSEISRDKIKGVILSGAGRNPNLILGLGSFLASLVILFKGKHYRSKLINGMSFGSFNKSFKPNRTEYDWLNTDDAEVDKYVNDEWCGGIFTVKYFHDFFKGCMKITNNLKKIPKSLPILLISGDHDPVGNMGKGVKTIYDNLIKTKHQNVQMKLVPGRHEILLEKCKEEVIKEIIEFINKIN